MTSPHFLWPLVRAFLPLWWVERMPLNRAAEHAREFRIKWDALQLFAEPEAADLFRVRVAALAGDIAYWSGGVEPKDGGAPYVSPEMERTALLQLSALCLSRLAALEVPRGHVEP